MEKYLLPFFYSFALSILLISFLLWIGKKQSLQAIKRFGGVAVILVFVLLVIFNKDLVMTKPILGILAGGILILILGLWDDIKSLNWKTQLLFQIAVALTAISFGVKSGYISNPFGSAVNLENPLVYLPIFTLYFLLFINSLNWLDGIDGLSGSVSLVVLGTIFLLSFKPEVNQPATAILSAISGGAVLGFLVLNWSPAKILAGTTGAWFFGFILASLSIFAGAKIATVLMVAIIPILDFMRVIWERYRAGQPIFLADKDRHLHFRLLKTGFREKSVVFFVCSASLLIGAAALYLKASGKLAIMALVIIIYSFFFIVWPKKQKL